MGKNLSVWTRGGREGYVVVCVYNIMQVTVMILSLEQGFSTCEQLPPPRKPVSAALKGINNCSLMKLACTFISFRGDTISVEKSHSLEVTSQIQKSHRFVACHRTKIISDGKGATGLTERLCFWVKVLGANMGISQCQCCIGGYCEYDLKCL